MSNSFKYFSNYLSIFTVIIYSVLFFILVFTYFHTNNIQDIRFQKQITTKSILNTTISLDYLSKIHKSITIEKMNKVLLEHKYYENRTDPFPHAIIDNLFPNDIIQLLSNEIPDNVKIYNNCTITHHVCIKDNIQYGKSGYNQEKHFGPITKSIFAYFRSSIFLKFLEKLTKINGLIPDPHYLGSGIHQTIRDGYLKIHSDSNVYSTSIKLHRRINLFLFINNEWKDHYNGHLELWSKDTNYCYQKIIPIFNRLVIFSCTDYSYHGHPKPLQCPITRSRRSLALYYYTTQRPSNECYHEDCDRNYLYGQPMPTQLVQTKCQSCDDILCKKWN